jgi:hypothetical protein
LAGYLPANIALTSAILRGFESRLG